MYNLDRFLKAQEFIYSLVISELKAGRKETHWIWYIFPQLKDLGYSYNSEYYGLSGIEEAKAYLSHPILGSRLIECCKLLLAINGRSIEEIMPYPDNLKVKSCMELFMSVSEKPFRDVLLKYY